MARRRTRRPVLVNLNQTSVQSQKKMKKKAKQITAIGRALRAAGTWGGGALGSYVGAPLMGGSVGNQLGALASKWLGFGEYTVAKNSIITKASNSIPGMHDEGQSIVVRHKEFIGQIVSSTGFVVQYELPLNPGMTQTFPWLSGVADRFQEYAFKGVVFHYIPTSGHAISGTSPSLGSVMMQTSYRASDEAPIDKVEMMNEFWASESVPSETFIHPLECDPKENPFNVHYIRNDAPPVADSLMMYDLGRTYIATNGQLAAGNVLGDLWVTYEVELKKPLIRSNVITRDFQMARFDGGGTLDTLFANPVQDEGNNYMVFDASAGLTIPVGSGRLFLMIVDFYSMNFSSFDKNGVSPPVTINCQLSNPNLIESGMAVSKIISGSAQGMVYMVIRVQDPGLKATIDFNASLTGVGTVGKTSVVVVKIE